MVGPGYKLLAAWADELIYANQYYDLKIQCIYLIVNKHTTASFKAMEAFGESRCNHDNGFIVVANAASP